MWTYSWESLTLENTIMEIMNRRGRTREAGEEWGKRKEENQLHGKRGKHWPVFTGFGERAVWLQPQRRLPVVPPPAFRALCDFSHTNRESCVRYGWDGRVWLSKLGHRRHGDFHPALLLITLCGEIAAMSWRSSRSPAQLPRGEELRVSAKDRGSEPSSK